MPGRDTRHTARVTSADRAVRLLRALAAGGVRDVVLAPGSRSAPLALAAYAADAAGELRLHVRIDERSAGFVALGLAMRSRRPVAVVTTSGTAVGNLLPAVMEAHHSARRIVVVSADRPAALRGTGANQTTWQAGVFGRFAPCWDLPTTEPAKPIEVIETAVAAALAEPGPSQLNVQFAPPLVPAGGLPRWPVSEPSAPVAAPADHPEASDRSAPPDRGDTPGNNQSGAAPVTLAHRPKTVVVAGDDAGPQARAFAEAHGLPLLAEPTSGARAGAHAIGTYGLLLGAGHTGSTGTRYPSELASQIERVIVTGHPTLSRPVTALLSRADIEIYAVRSPATGLATDPGRCARVLDDLPQIEPPASADRWLAAWQAADAQLSARLADYLDELPELHALQVAAEVAAALGAGQTLVVGSSNPVRDLDLVMAPGPPGERRSVVGNRGLAGIDGLVSTAVGVALGHPHTPRTLALIGDLAFLHDTNGLLLGPDEPRPDLTIVVVNDDGGSIFALLEQGAPEYAAAFERVFATPHGTDLAARCAATGTAYQRVTTRAQLRAALTDPVGQSPGIQIVEAPVGRTDRRATAMELAALVEPGVRR